MLFEFKVCCPLDSGTPTSFPGGSGLSQSDFPRPGSCGPVVVEKIVGGNTTSISDYPWYVIEIKSIIFIEFIINWM